MRDEKLILISVILLSPRWEVVLRMGGASGSMDEDRAGVFTINGDIFQQPTSQTHGGVHGEGTSSLRPLTVINLSFVVSFSSRAAVVVFQFARS